MVQKQMSLPLPTSGARWAHIILSLQYMAYCFFGMFFCAGLYRLFELIPTQGLWWGFLLPLTLVRGFGQSFMLFDMALYAGMILAWLVEIAVSVFFHRKIGLVIPI